MGKVTRNYKGAYIKRQVAPPATAVRCTQQVRGLERSSLVDLNLCSSTESRPHRSDGLSTRKDEGSRIPSSLRPRLLIILRRSLVYIAKGGKADPGQTWLTSREVI